MYMKISNFIIALNFCLLFFQSSNVFASPSQPTINNWITKCFEQNKNHEYLIKAIKIKKTLKSKLSDADKANGITFNESYETSFIAKEIGKNNAYWENHTVWMVAITENGITSIFNEANNILNCKVDVTNNVGTKSIIPNEP